MVSLYPACKKAAQRRDPVRTLPWVSRHVSAEASGTPSCSQARFLPWWQGLWNAEGQRLLARRLVWGPRACGPHTVNSSHLVGILVAAKLPKDIVMYTSWGETKTAPRLHCVFKHVLLNSGKFMEAGICSLQRKWETQKCFHAQEPHRVLLDFKICNSELKSSRRHLVQFYNQ